MEVNDNDVHDALFGHYDVEDGVHDVNNGSVHDVWDKDVYDVYVVFNVHNDDVNDVYDIHDDNVFNIQIPGCLWKIRWCPWW